MATRVGLDMTFRLYREPNEPNNPHACEIPTGHAGSAAAHTVCVAPDRLLLRRGYAHDDILVR